MNATLFLGLIQAILTIIADGSLSANKKQTAISYLGFAGQLIDSGIATDATLVELSERIKTGVPISQGEWDALKARSDSAYAAIQAQETSLPS